MPKMPASNKIYDHISDFKSELDKLRDSKQKIVFTNGCFDIIHPGHVDILQKAKELGDILIVGLNTDASIAGLKGPRRPIQNLTSRSLVLAGLASVDVIIPFDTPTPLDLIQEIKPDVLVKGGDYQIHEIVGSEFVSHLGGTVTTIPFLEGYSSSAIINKIKQENYDQDR